MIIKTNLQDEIINSNGPTIFDTRVYQGQKTSNFECSTNLWYRIEEKDGISHKKLAEYSITNDGQEYNKRRLKPIRLSSDIDLKCQG